MAMKQFLEDYMDNNDYIGALLTILGRVRLNAAFGLLLLPKKHTRGLGGMSH